MSSFYKQKTIFIVLLVVCSLFFTQPVSAEDVPQELQGSGRPVPRFVTLDTDKAYVRTGPAPRYPVKYVYKKVGLPVEIIQEFDVWRKIKDIDGDEGWINKALLSDKRGVVIQSKTPVDLREGFSQNARVIAHLENGVIAKLQKCTETWCQITSGGYQGWVQRNFLWGLYPKEEIH
jgi:SH3-like domain-containing protein